MRAYSLWRLVSSGYKNSTRVRQLSDTPSHKTDVSLSAVCSVTALSLSL